MIRHVPRLLPILFCGLALQAPAADAPPAPVDLAAREAELLRQYRDLERAFLRLADLLDASDPRRAALLRAACEKARGEQVGERIEAIVAELEAGRLLKAGAGQEDSLTQLRGLLDLLAAGADDRRREDGRQQVREFVSRLAKAIARQRDIQGSTEAGADEAELARKQAALADDARKLAEDLGRFADRDQAGTPPNPAPSRSTPPQDAPAQKKKPPDGQTEPAEGEAEPSSADAAREPAAADEGDDESARARRTRQRLEAAERRMRSAERQLETARRGEARADQDKALEELENARAELEEILRQLREDEVERLLVQLAARIRQMLKAEKAVRAGAEELAAAGAETAGPAARQRQLEAARLGREQAAIGQSARRTLAVVRDDGSAVAIPQALEQVRDDAEQASRRLERGDVGGTTMGLLDDLVAGLEEMLAAVEQAQRDQQSRREAGAQGGGQGQSGERPLVDAIAELKMLRSLQLRVNTRTSRFALLLGDDTAVADRPELRAALGRLAERQRLIERAAHDIASGKTE